ncbi:MAG: ribonuclease E/G, partial [Beijerinckiaceae bacterium]
YQIPTADRIALLEEEERAAKDSQKRYDERGKRRRRDRNAGDDVARSAIVSDGETESLDAADDTAAAEMIAEASAQPELDIQATGDSADAAPDAADVSSQPFDADGHSDHRTDIREEDAPHEGVTISPDDTASDGEQEQPQARDRSGDEGDDDADGDDEDDADEDDDEDDEEEQVVEQVGGGDAFDEMQERPRFTHRRHYKIQEVIKRRQILLVQVVKEERGTKGAALTTYLSLAGRYSVLMPNTARGGGISRKITSAQDRKRLKELVQDLEVPDGMGVILRTAGAARTKMEIQRDFEYLMRLWESVRELTLQSSAPALVYEEGSLIKRSIRDLYSKDIEEIQVAGDEGCREAKDFMRMLMPSHARQVKQYRDHTPLFTKFGVEPQLDAMFSNQVTLKSGGYLVINQ